MKRLVFLLGFCGMLVSAADVSGVHSVYMLPMSRGLDQYLANRLTNDRVFQVVTDPKVADAVFTDRIGEAFEAQMENLYPTPEPAAPAATEAKAKDAKKDEPKPMGLAGEAANKLSNPAVNSAFGRGKGMVFLVDVKSRQVVWSAYEPPKGLGLDDIDRSASEIVGRLKKELFPKAK